ncbi:MAG TPA: hypothetical protein VLF14_10920, partial [Candidatus Binatia bacterium]|nr:hypothetical protein [Candidatus Binatia bacterium]
TEMERAAIAERARPAVPRLLDSLPAGEPSPASRPAVYVCAKFWLMLGGLFLFRLGFGLASDFWSPDELQVYLIGVKFYSTHSWPYFGADVDPMLRPIAQVPGALQGLVVGLPFFVFAVPEAPYVLLNVLSFAGLALLAWYCTKRLPELSPWAIWAWMLTAPWVLGFSTQVINPSYVLFGSCLFFVGMMETCRPLRRDLLPVPLASFLMGFSLFWIMQFHLSWVILLPYVLMSAYYQTADGVRPLCIFSLFFLLGASLPASLLAPTLLEYGRWTGLGGTDNAVALNWANLTKFFTVLTRYLSFASFQIYRFFEVDADGWVPLLKSRPWLIPVVSVPALMGVLQQPAMVALWLRKAHTQEDWKAIKYLALFTFLLVYVSFCFTRKGPKAHTFYVCFPVVFIYSLYCWSFFATWTGWKTLVQVFLVGGIIAQGVYAYHGAQGRSLYRNRDVPLSALEARDYHLLAERRSGARY